MARRQPHRITPGQKAATKALPPRRRQARTVPPLVPPAELPPHIAALTPADQVFVLEYLATNSATAAYQKAHPDAAAATARVQGCRRRQVPAIDEAIRLERQSRFRQAALDEKAILGAIIAIAFSDIRELYDENGCVLPPAQWPDRIASCVEAYELKDGNVKVRLAAKFPALVKLAEKAGLFEKDQGANDLGALIAAVAARRRQEDGK